MIQKSSIITRFQSIENIVNLDKDFFLVEIGKKDFPNKPILNNLYQCSIGVSGSCICRVNLTEISQSAGTIAINLPNQFVEIQNVSDDYKAILIAMSPDFFRSFGFKYNYQTANRIKINPIITLSKSELEALTNYTKMVRSILIRKRPYAKDILQHLTAALLYSMADNIIKTLPSNMSREESLTQRFLELISNKYRDYRKVTYYALELGLTPGYLSSIVKTVTQKSAAEWIDEYVMLEAKALLASSDLTVQQICHRLNFPSQSFFGKYFKRHSGLSPTQYRQKL